MKINNFKSIIWRFCLPLALSVVQMVNIGNQNHVSEKQTQLFNTLSYTFTSQCECTSSSGILKDSVIIDAPSGLTWSSLVQDNVSSVSAIIENPIGSGKYKLVVEYISTQKYTLALSSNKNDIITINGRICSGSNATILGNASSCLNATSSYNLAGVPSGTSVIWQLSGGGTITPNGNQASVTWGAAPGTFVLEARRSSGLCPLLATFEVKIGNAINEPLVCFGQVNVSLDSTCSKKIDIPTLTNQNIPASSAATIILTDESGNIIPNAIVTNAHIGQNIKARLYDGCSGNECWGYIKVEDKSAPIITCAPQVILECYKMANYLGPIVSGECSTFELIKVAPDRVTDLSCDPNYIRKVTQSYQAQDKYFNKSTICTQEILVKKFPLDSVRFPIDYLENNTTFNCKNGNDTSPSKAGFPSIDGIILSESFYESCNIFIEYSDVIIDLPGKKKISRNWKITETSCGNGTSKSHTQLIIVMDLESPKINRCPANITLSTNGQKCEANYSLPKLSAADVSDDCSTSFIFDIVAMGNTMQNVNSTTSTLVNFPVGTHEVFYYAFDASGKKDSCKQLITVMDKTPPTLVCLQNGVIGLSNSKTVINFKMLEIASNDDCGIASKQIRRMPTDSLSNVTYKDTLHLTCEDVGKTIRIEMRVTDLAGNVNTCMSNITVQDKTPPRLTIPANVTLTCEQYSNLVNFSTLGIAQVSDECEVSLTEKIDSSLNLCKSGTILRIFIAKDKANTVVDTQRITILQSANFDPSTIIAPIDAIVTNMCNTSNFHPDSLAKIDARYGRPSLPTTRSCDLIGITYKDQEYAVENNALGNCSKIVRKWFITNHCIGNSGTIIREMTQLIIVRNTNKPNITVSPASLTFETTTCNDGTYTIAASANDDCTASSLLRWTYDIVKADAPNTNIQSGIVLGGTFLVNRTLSIGRYIAILRVSDGCGNIAESQKPFTIAYKKAPIIYGVDTLVTSLTAMVTTEMSCLNIDTLIKYDIHPCNLPLKYSFSPTDLTQKTRCFDCDNIGNNTIFIYATDPYGNVGSYKVTIIVQDNNDKNICSTLSSCVTFPRDTTISSCATNLEPNAIRSTPTINSDCACTNFDFTYTDRFITPYPNADCSYIERKFTVNFRCPNRIESVFGTQIIKAPNRVAPSINCPSNIVANATVGCETQVTVPAPTIVSNACNSGITISYRKGNQSAVQGSIASGIYPVGTTTVTYIATNACGNSSTCSVLVTVNDNAGPICSVKDITINVNAQGIATITNPNLFDNGTTDACNNLPLTFSATPSTFNCSAGLGANPVTVTVRDASGNSTTCSANVFLRDTIKPIVTPRNITVDITNQNPTSTINARQLVASASDNCSLGDTSVNKTSFTCADLGANNVIVSVTDASGNVGTAIAIVTVRDLVNPICRIKDITIDVNANGVASIGDPSLFDNGSTDECNTLPLTFAVSPSSFNCNAGLGANPVTVTVRDANGNSTTCSANVFLRDTIKPIVTPRNITVDITNQNPTSTINARQLVASASDNCSLVDTSVNKTSFTCADLGANNVIVSVTDASGNVGTATAIVTVRDLVNPICRIKDITIDVNANGIANITDPSLFNNGSTDECNSLPLTFAVSPSTFNCSAGLGANPVTVTVRDANGNSTTCSANVFLRDTIKPIVTPRNITVDITNQNPTATFNARQLVASASDNCSIVDTSVNKTSFTCADLGANNVIVSVTDASGNVGTATAIVTVRDMAAPICRLRNVAILLNNEGQATITDASIFNAGSVDECNSLPLVFSVNKNTFNCSNLVTPSTVIVTVADGIGNSTTCTATVTVRDTIRPVLVTRNITVDLTSITSPASIQVGQLVVSASDNCSVVDTLLSKVAFTCLDLGANIVRVVARDGSGNTISADAIVTVIDRIAPICKLKSGIVTVNGGSVTVDSSLVNDGSFDPCGQIASITLSPNTFSCADIGMKRVSVTIRDIAGNTTTCDTTIQVVEGTTLICRPKDITIFLDANGQKTITANDVDNGSGTGCNNPVAKTIDRSIFNCEDIGQPINVLLTVTNMQTNQSSVCTSKVTVKDTIPPSIICTQEFVTINCSDYKGTIPESTPRPMILFRCRQGYTLDSTIIRLPRACNLDILTRTYRLIDPNGDIVSTCVQTIRVVNDKVLTLDSFSLPTNNFVVNSCTYTLPSATGGSMSLKPTVSKGCSKFGFTYTDAYNNNSCNDTLRRTWTAIDSCNNLTVFTYVQNIIINDNVSPVFTGLQDTIVYNNGSCGVNLSFPNIKVEDCDERVIVKNNSRFSKDTLSLNPSGFYPIGRHQITFTAKDKCGNSSTGSLTIQVRDTSVNSVICRNENLSLNANGIATVLASNLIRILGEDFCDPSQYKFKAVFSTGLGANDTSSSKVYNCTNFQVNGNSRSLSDTVELIIYNMALNPTTIFSRCRTILTVTDSSRICTTSQLTIKGNISSLKNEKIKGFKVVVESNKGMIESSTDRIGNYELKGLVDDEALISAEKRDDYLDGVNTLDLIKIQRHILDISKFSSPYQYIAADVNNDKKISVTDLIELQKLILGYTEKLENNVSWKAINKNAPTMSMENVLAVPAPNYISVAEYRKIEEGNFLGIKIGDVDDSYLASNLGESILTNRNSVQLLQVSKAVKKGEIIELPVIITEDNYGLQMNFKIKNSELLAIKSKNKSITHQDLIAKDDIVKLIAISPYLMKGNELLFTIQLVANQDGQYSDFISFSDQKEFKNTLVDETLSNRSFTVTWQKEIEEPKEADIFEISQNYPNPWITYSQIDIRSTGKTNAGLKISNLIGQTIHTKNINLEKGLNSLTLDRHLIKDAGVYFIELTVGNERLVKKMIVTN